MLDENERRRVGRVLAALSPLSQKELSLKAGWAEDRLRTALDRGKNSPPSTDELLQLAKLVDVPDHFVIEGFGSPLHERVADLEAVTEALGETLRKVVGDTFQHRLAIRELSGQRLPAEREEDTR
jgi:hypothetical protein